MGKQTHKASLDGTTVPRLWEMSYDDTHLLQRHWGCDNLIDWKNN